MSWSLNFEFLTLIDFVDFGHGYRTTTGMVVVPRLPHDLYTQREFQLPLNFDLNGKLKLLISWFPFKSKFSNI
jgi:hypothetical protein